MYAANIVVSHGDYPVSKSKNYLMIEKIYEKKLNQKKYLFLKSGGKYLI